MSRGDKLAEYQAANRQKTVDAIDRAKQEVEAELARHGFYPHNNGKITRREVCKRAGIGESTLKNQTHRATAAALDRWLARLRKEAPTLKPAAEDAKQARIKALQDQLDLIAQHYNLFKLDHNELLRRVEALETENACLKQTVADLLAAGGKVVGMPRRR